MMMSNSQSSKQSPNNTHGQSTSVSNRLESSIDRSPWRYKMDHPNRGKCIIICIKDFENPTAFPHRKEWYKDVERLNQVFNELKFEVETHLDLKYLEICKVLEKASKEDHDEADCLVVCFLSYGEGEFLRAYDERFCPSKLCEHFTTGKCPSLTGKPKLFFVQSHGGSYFDSSCVMPAQWDFLISVGYPPARVSWRDPMCGSLFVEILCNVLKKHHKTENLRDMMDRVGRQVGDVAGKLQNEHGESMEMEGLHSIGSLRGAIYF